MVLHQPPPTLIPECTTVRLCLELWFTNEDQTWVHFGQQEREMKVNLCYSTEIRLAVRSIPEDPVIRRLSDNWGLAPYCTYTGFQPNTKGVGISCGAQAGSVGLGIYFL